MPAHADHGTIEGISRGVNRAVAHENLAAGLAATHVDTPDGFHVVEHAFFHHQEPSA